MQPGWGDRIGLQDIKCLLQCFWSFMLQTNEIRTNAANFLVQISDLLNRIPRQLLLILKTNDVLRGIESSLRTRANATSFINMSRCCVRALATERLRNCESRLETCKIKLGCQWQLCKIGLYELFLWLQSSALGSFICKVRNKSFCR